MVAYGESLSTEILAVAIAKGFRTVSVLDLCIGWMGIEIEGEATEDIQ